MCLPISQKIPFFAEKKQYLIIRHTARKRFVPAGKCTSHIEHAPLFQSAKRIVCIVIGASQLFCQNGRRNAAFLQRKRNRRPLKRTETVRILRTAMFSHPAPSDKIFPPFCGIRRADRIRPLRLCRRCPLQSLQANRAALSPH